MGVFRLYADLWYTSGEVALAIKYLTELDGGEAFDLACHSCAEVELASVPTNVTLMVDNLP